MGKCAGTKAVGGACMVEEVACHHITAKEAPGNDRPNKDSPCTGVSSPAEDTEYCSGKQEEK